MNQHEFRAAVQRHGYSLAEFAGSWGVAYETVRRWGADYGVPRWVQRVLALMDQHGRAKVAMDVAQNPGAAAAAEAAPAQPQGSTAGLPGPMPNQPAQPTRARASKPRRRASDA
jgi:hypothetical protein